MKKTVSIIVSLIISSLFSVTAFSEAYEATYAPAMEEPVAEEYEEDILAVTTTIAVVTASEEPNISRAEKSFVNMGELFQYWHETDKDGNPYPDYVCGVWSTDGGMDNLTVAVTKDEKGETGKNEILELIEDDTSVTFTYASYSFAELFAVNEEILPLMGDSTGVIGLGIYEMENVVHALIDTSNPNSEGFMEKCFKQYGDMIRFEHSSGFFTESFDDMAGGIDIGGASVTEAGAALTTGAVETETSDNTLLICIISVFAVLIIGCTVLGIRSVAVRQTTAGNVTEGTALTKKKTEELIKNTLEEPQSDMFSKIMEKTEK